MQHVNENNLCPSPHGRKEGDQKLRSAPAAIRVLTRTRRVASSRQQTLLLPRGEWNNHPVMRHQREAKTLPYTRTKN
jgi:hypothetical protein